MKENLHVPQRAQNWASYTVMCNFFYLYTYLNGTVHYKSEVYFPVQSHKFQHLCQKWFCFFVQKFFVFDLIERKGDVIISKEGTPYDTKGCTHKKGGSKMALFATPHKQAFCIEAEDENILRTASNAALDALRKIRKAESSSKNVVRLHQLDQQIRVMQEKGK